MYKVDEKIQKSFQDDPKLLRKSLMEIAEYFFLKGREEDRFARDAFKSKVEFYRGKLGDIDFDKLCEADKTWDELNNEE